MNGGDIMIHIHIGTKLLCTEEGKEYTITDIYVNYNIDYVDNKIVHNNCQTYINLVSKNNNGSIIKSMPAEELIKLFIPVI